MAGNPTQLFLAHGLGVLLTSTLFAPTAPGDALTSRVEKTSFVAQHLDPQLEAIINEFRTSIPRSMAKHSTCAGRHPLIGTSG